MDDLDLMLQRWTREGHISAAQADAIRAREARAGDPPRSVPIIAEAIAYVGAVFILSAATFVASQAWSDLGSQTRLAILTLATAALWAGGWWMREGREPMLRRLVSVLWFLSAGGLAWTADLVATDLIDIENGYALVIGVSLVLYSGILYLHRRSSLQQVALGFGALFTCAGLSDLAGGDDWFGPLLWLVGAGWIALTRLGRLTP